MFLFLFFVVVFGGRGLFCRFCVGGVGLFGDIVCLFDVCILLYLFSFEVKMLLFWGVVFMLLILRTWYGVVRGRSLFIRCLFIVVFCLFNYYFYFLISCAL